MPSEDRQPLETQTSLGTLSQFRLMHKQSERAFNRTFDNGNGAPTKPRTVRTSKVLLRTNSA